MYSSVIISVDSGVGGHVVVADAVTEEGVKIRDPAHGWCTSLYAVTQLDLRPVRACGTSMLALGE